MNGARRYGMLVFDWDGTLVDSIAHITSTMQRTIEALSLPPRDVHEIRQVIGLGIYEALDRLFPGMSRTDHERIKSAYRESFLGGGVRARAFPRARETVEALADQGYLVTVATGKGRAGLDRELAETGFDTLVMASRCADECGSKPNPRMLLELVGDFGLEPREALMVGDAEYDLQMAANAGSDAVAVRSGAHDDARLVAHGPLALIDTVADLPGVLQP